jgi:hypothetical protein
VNSFLARMFRRPDHRGTLLLARIEANASLLRTLHRNDPRRGAIEADSRKARHELLSRRHA